MHNVKRDGLISMAFQIIDDFQTGKSANTDTKYDKSTDSVILRIAGAKNK